MSTHRRAGLTLVELLVVLAILAIMTTMAVTATNTLVDQARYDATQRTLQSIDEAIVGPPNSREPDGSLLISGFVADIGRVPLAVVDAGDPDEAYKRLRELWLPVGAVPAYGPQNATQAGTPDGGPADIVPIRCGWRGPYVRLSPASTGAVQLIRDGWGNPFDQLNPTRAAAPHGDAIGIVRSRGADFNVDPFPPPTDYNGDQRVSFRALVPDGVTGEPAIDRISGSITVHIKVFNPTGGSNGTGGVEDPKATDGTVVVRCFYPINGVAKFVGKTVTPPVSPETRMTETFTDVPIGPRAIRAYQGTTKRSAVTYLMVPPGGPPEKTLILYNQP
jgi:prepilin-type N-terminal cleavage/methylation domain-containing protein